GSTNFIIHLLAIAGRIGVPLSLDDFEAVAAGIPLLLNLQPSGRFFMEDLYYAGGIPAVMKAVLPRLHRDVLTVNGKSVAENAVAAECFNEEVIAPLDKPVNAQSGIWVLKGNLCEQGAVIRPNAATPALMVHRGRAVVFDNIEDFKARIDDPSLDVDATSVLVLKNVGPKGYPGMPEVGNMGIPKKLLDKGVTDMVRISDGRMSGTAFGTVVLHVSPEAAAGGTLALVADGDLIRLDVAGRRLELLVDEADLAGRRELLRLGRSGCGRGYGKLYVDRVEQAHLGADFDFLKGGSGSEVSRDSH